MVQLRILSYLFTIILCSSAKADSCLETSDELKKLSSSLPKILGPAATKDMAQFCQINGYRDAQESLNKNDAGGSWIANFVPTFDSREKTFFIEFPSDQVRPGHSNYDDVESEMRKAPALTGALKDKCNKGFEKIKSGSSIPQNLAASGVFFKGYYLCSDVTHTRSQTLGCATGVHKIYEDFNPSGEIPLVSLWKEVFNDPTYAKVFQQVGLKIVGNIRNKQVPETNLFDEIKAAFFQETHNSKLSEDYAWKSMAFLSSEGTNMTDFINGLCGGPSSLGTSVFLINQGSVMLDRMTAPKGYLYSYPKGVGNVCDYGKNYHFWMSAYLARELVKSGQSVFDSASAAYTTDKAYQFIKTGEGRDREEPFKSETFSNYNNNIRLDVSQAAAGAWFGALSVGKPDVNLSTVEVNEGIQKVFSGSKMLATDKSFQFPSEMNPIGLMSTYSKWKDILNPDGAFNYYDEVLKSKNLYSPN